METGIIIGILLIIVIIAIDSKRRPDGINSRKMKTAEERPINNSNSIFYHEDDYRQVEIVPAENFEELIKQAENVEDFSNKHFDGIGYTDMVIREENKITLKQRGITPNELDSMLSKLPIQKFDKVSTGIRPGEMMSENTIGYGGNYNGIFFDFKSNAVTGIWIAGSLDIDGHILTEILNEIGKKWNLLLMDWNSLELIDLKNKDQIAEYLRYDY